MPPWVKPPDEDDLKRMLARHRAEETFVRKAREFATPIFLLLALVLLVGVWLLLDNYSVNNCKAKGGEWTHHGSNGICLTPGSVIK